MMHRALIIVENNSYPFDTRVRREAQTLLMSNWQVVVISPKGLAYNTQGSQNKEDQASYEIVDGVHVYRYHLQPGEGGPFSFIREYLSAFFQTTYLVLKIWRKHGFDVMQVCNPPDLFFPLGWLCRLMGKAFIFDHHDLAPEIVTQRWGSTRAGRLILPIIKWTEKLSLRTAHAVISTNESYRQIAIDRGGVEPDKVFVVRNGPKFDEWVPVERDLSLLKGRSYLVGYFGIMGPEDGLKILLESIRSIVYKFGRRDIQFVLVGDGPLYPWLVENSKAWGLDEFVALPGMSVGQAERLRYISSFDVCVAPEPPTPFNIHSTIMKVAEYLILGKPVVAFDLKETRFTAQDAAVYVDEVSPDKFGEAILYLLENEKLREELADYRRNMVKERLSWDIQEPIFLTAYQKALETTGSLPDG